MYLAHAQILSLRRLSTGVPGLQLFQRALALSVGPASRCYHPDVTAMRSCFLLTLRRLRLGVEGSNIRGTLRYFRCIHPEQLGNTFKTLGDLSGNLGAGR